MWSKNKKRTANFLHQIISLHSMKRERAHHLRLPKWYPAQLFRCLWLSMGLSNLCIACCWGIYHHIFIILPGNCADIFCLLRMGALVRRAALPSHPFAHSVTTMRGSITTRNFLFNIGIDFAPLIIPSSSCSLPSLPFGSVRMSVKRLKMEPCGRWNAPKYWPTIRNHWQMRAFATKSTTLTSIRSQPHTHGIHTHIYGYCWSRAHTHSEQWLQWDTCTL